MAPARPTACSRASIRSAKSQAAAGRVFVHDLNGPLYILDKKSKALTTYLNFNGRDSKPGIFRKLAWEVGFANGLVTFQFDPAYQSNGRFYTVHIEDPAVDAASGSRQHQRPGLQRRRATP